MAKRVIYVGPAAGSNRAPLHIEGIAIRGAIKPGLILERAAGGLDKNTSGPTVFGEQLIIADKDQQHSRSVDEAWTVDENIVAIVPRSGEFVNALVQQFETLVRGDPMSRRSGMLKKAVIPPTVGITSEDIVGFADETITTSGFPKLVCIRVA